MIRAQILDGLEFLGVEVDQKSNQETVSGKTGLISTPDSRLAAYVIPTDEELLIARDAVRCISC